MKKIILSLFALIFLVSVVSAAPLPSAPVCSYGACDHRPNQTLIWGDIHDGETGIGIVGAYVQVDCNGYTLERLTTHNGYYAVFYDQSECSFGNEVTITASYGDLSGVKTGVVDHNEETNDWSAIVDMDLTRINVPLVPEFSTIVAMLTAISAIVVFFVVRK